MTEKELLDLREEISQAKEKVAGLQGQQELLMKQLKDNWSCNSVDEAEKKLAAMEKEVEQLTALIERKTEDIYKDYQIIHG
jgi:hypothetical protein